ncbi:threonine synthase [Marinoscillum sp. MHG1-6]|uniref:threonine synthase n=1 Tax=Marinoscillum sp. MHG1-6 TaxID=2959627 RepID=UPI002157DCA9|nr:threonine synthase [Marinoscillum sp. MHG1-6]
MKFYSTKGKNQRISFKEAVIKSLPQDNGLYFPEIIPVLGDPFFSEYGSYTLPEIGTSVMKHFCSDDIPLDKLEEIMEDVLSFDIPLVSVAKNINSLELFHGPTYAFKDVGARFLARCLGYFNESENKEVTILVATSGDTGGAVAAGFYKVPGVKVIILYPTGKVSELQEKQLTTLGENITALEVDGDFDDCQALVKLAFLDKEINEKLALSSANSINIARWLPQSIYYYQAVRKAQGDGNVVVSVPSGNYGNITAGMLAKKMGLPIHRFIAASNANDIVPRYIRNGSYEILPTIATLSNAMDVSNPSNFPRMMELYGDDWNAVKNDVKGYTLDDEHTLRTMQQCQSDHKYTLDPHGAIGYEALNKTLLDREVGVFLETAHPCKFIPTVEKALNTEYKIPDFAADLMSRRKQADPLGKQFSSFKNYLMA